MNTTQYWIDQLQLNPHPEGGWYREVYRSAEQVSRESLPARFGGDRNFSTAIYFLLPREDFSAFHRIAQDEVWHFYDGAPLTVHRLDPEGEYSTITMGRNPEKGEQLLGVVPAGWLFGATVCGTGSYSLVGCTVAPGFDFNDFEMPSREELLTAYPERRDVIERLTRSGE